MNLFFKILFLASFVTFSASSSVNKLQFDTGRKILFDKNENIGYLKEVKIKIDRSDGSAKYDNTSEFKTRFYLNNSKEVKLKKELMDVYNGVLTESQSKEEIDLFINTYTQFIEVFYGQKQLRSLIQMVKSTNDKLKTLKTLVGKGRVEITELIMAESKYIEMNGQMMDLKSSLKIKASEVNSKLTKKIKFNTLGKHSGLVSIAQIHKMMKKRIDIPVTPSLKLKMAELEYKVEKENENKLAEYFELSLKQGEKTKSGSFNFSVQFNLPSFSEKTKSSSKRIKLLATQFDTRAKLIKEKSKIQIKRNKILRKINTYNQIRNSKFQKSTKRFLKIYSKSKGVSPLKLLNLSFAIKENEFKKYEREMNIYKMYLDYLVTRGASITEIKKQILI